MKNTAVRTVLVGAVAAAAVFLGLAAPASAAPASTGVAASANASDDRVAVMGLHFTSFDGFGRPTAGYDDNEDFFRIRYYPDGYTEWHWSYGCEFLYDPNGVLEEMECL
ncbi:hypothetical protein [Lentzea sp. NPDC060358]|uniref:hypothetical protein n=1 Tax=Lentzea sp. NPDC060358 TaxID=3347103 RepID=UPI003660AF04